jgi:hypothetical protein
MVVGIYFIVVDILNYFIRQTDFFSVGSTQLKCIKHISILY